MTPTPNPDILWRLMDLRERLQAIQVEMAELTAILVSDKERDRVVTHATEPQDNAALHDSPPSTPLP